MRRAGEQALAWLLRYEVLWVTAMAWLVFCSIPITLGHIGLGWDALNHHIYLGWAAEHGRFNRDFWAASSQSYQVPYTYWPVYKLAVSGFDGVTAGMVLAALGALTVPPVWLMAKVCIPGAGAFELFMRCAAVALAFMSVVVLSLFGSTQNDLLAAVPLVWAFALALQGTAHGIGNTLVPQWRSIVLAGLLAGMAVTFKLSNGPLALLLPVLWFFQRVGFWTRVRDVALGSAATLAGCLVTFAPWGWQVWHKFGNPIYPLYDSAFAPVRALLGWQP